MCGSNRAVRTCHLARGAAGNVMLMQRRQHTKYGRQNWQFFAARQWPTGQAARGPLGPVVRISHLTSGAKGTRTPDPLLAKLTQVVQHGPWSGMEGSEHPAKPGHVHIRWCRLWVSARSTLGVNSATPGQAVAAVLACSAGRWESSTHSPAACLQAANRTQDGRTAAERADRTAARPRSWASLQPGSRLVRVSCDSWRVTTIFTPFGG